MGGRQTKLMNTIHDKLKDIMTVEEYNEWTNADEYDDNGFIIRVVRPGKLCIK